MPLQSSAHSVETPPRVRVHTLGRFLVEVDGEPLRFESRGHGRPLELLKVLIALGGVNVPTEQLADALWEDADGDAAERSLHSTLHRLRRLIGSDTLTLRNRSLSVDPGACWVDTVAFEGLVDTALAAANGTPPGALPALLDETLALYRGPFLAGEFEPVALLSARERLHAAFLRVIRHAGQLFATLGEPQRAMELYRRGLAADDLAEEFYQALMRLHLAQGQAAEGIAVYLRCKELLQAAVDVTPSAETEQLYEELLALRGNGRHDPPVIGSASAGPAPSAAVRIGRRLPALAAAVLMVLSGAALWANYRTPGIAPIEEFGPVAAAPLADHPSIAVLALQNLTGDPGQNDLTTGISETIRTYLARNPELNVVAVSTAFRDRRAPEDVHKLARELGVRFVFEGSLQQAADRLRITAQLIDSDNGTHFWSQQYDHPGADRLQVADDVSLRIAHEMNVLLVRGEWARGDLRATTSVGAYDRYLQAQHLALSFEQEPVERAIGLLEQAIELDPAFNRAMGLLGWTYLRSVHEGWDRDAPAAREKAERLARRARAFGPEVNTFLLQARVLAARGEYGAAITAGRKATDLEPGNGWALAQLGWLYNMAGRPQEGVPLIRRAVRLTPRPPALLRYREGWLEYAVENYRAAIEAFRAALNQATPNSNLEVQARVGVITSYMMMGLFNEGRMEAKPYRRDMAYSIRRIMTRALRADFKYIDTTGWSSQLRQAGLPK